MPSPIGPLSGLLPEILKIEKISQGAAGFSIGDRIEALILKNAGGKLLVSLNGSAAIQAESAVPLQPGETVAVRVEQLQPSLVLRLTDPAGAAAAEADRMGALLRLDRSNPGALLNLISELPAKFDLKGLAPFLSFLDRKNLANLVRILQEMPLSGKTAGDNLFFRNYVEGLGFLWESGLKKALREGGIERERAGLKGALMTLSGELNGLAEKSDLFDAAALARLKELQRAADGSVRTLESGQAFNVLLQETENRYLLQIPFLFPSGPRMADLSIEFEGEGKEGERQAGFRIVFLLDLDALGDLSVEADIKGKRLSGLFRCTDREASAFISSSLGKLEDALAGLGYKIGSLSCRYEDDLSGIREYFQSARGVGGRDAVNIFV